jgi:hypothetical protein
MRSIILVLIGVVVVFSAIAGITSLNNFLLSLFGFFSAIVYSIIFYLVYQNNKKGYYATIIASIIDLPIAMVLFSGYNLLIALAIDLVLILLSIMQVRKK